MYGAEGVFWMIIGLVAGFALLFTSLHYIMRSQTERGIDFKNRRIAFICLPSGMLILMLSLFVPLRSMEGESWTGEFLMALFMYLLVPANEFDRMAYYAPYGQQEKEKKFRRAKIWTYVLLGVLEVVAFRHMFFEMVGI